MVKIAKKTKPAKIVNNKKDLGIIYIYVQEGCPLCKSIKDNIDIVRDNFSMYEEVVLVDAKKSKTFFGHNFRGLPVLLIPMHRPYETIHPKYLVVPELARNLINGVYDVSEVIHDKERKRRDEGLYDDSNYLARY